MRRRKVKRKKVEPQPLQTPGKPNYAAGLIREIRMKYHQEEVARSQKTKMINKHFSKGAEGRVAVGMANDNPVIKKCDDKVFKIIDEVVDNEA